MSIYRTVAEPPALRPFTARDAVPSLFIVVLSWVQGFDMERSLVLSRVLGAFHSPEESSYLDRDREGAV